MEEKQIIRQIIDNTFNHFDTKKKGYLEIDEIQQMIRETFLNDNFDEKEFEENPEKYNKALKDHTDRLLEEFGKNNKDKIMRKDLAVILEPLILEILNKSVETQE